MINIILDSVLDSLKDTVISLPVLFVAYLLMELLERSEKLNESMLNSYSKKVGPALGGILGAVPQCGISGAAATLFSTGAISLGTMMAVFFATSDEMIPVMLSAAASGDTSIRILVRIVILKVILGIALGYVIDFLFRKRILSEKNISSFCERDNCSCGDEDGSAVISALRHTLHIAVILFAVCTLLNVLFAVCDISSRGASGTSGFGACVICALATAAFGLIPNCSVSVILTESYLSGLIGPGGLFAGLLSNAGIGLIVLFRTNKDLRENVAITAILFTFAAVCGLVISLLAG